MIPLRGRNFLHTNEKSMYVSVPEFTVRAPLVGHKQALSIIMISLRIDPELIMPVFVLRVQHMPRRCALRAVHNSTRVMLLRTDRSRSQTDVDPLASLARSLPYRSPTPKNQMWYDNNASSVHATR